MVLVLVVNRAVYDRASQVQRSAVRSARKSEFSTEVNCGPLSTVMGMVSTRW